MRLHILYLPLKFLGCIYDTSGETPEDILGGRKRIIIIIRIWKKQTNNRRVYRLCRSTLIILRKGHCGQYKAKTRTDMPIPVLEGYFCWCKSRASLFFMQSKRNLTLISECHISFISLPISMAEVSFD